MKLNDDGIYILQIRVRDHITCKEYGSQITNYDDKFHLPTRLNLDDYELDRLIESLSNIKKFIIKERSDT